MDNKRQNAGGRRTHPRCCCENCDLDNGCRGDVQTCKGQNSDLPRRCLVIKRTHPEEGIERTELRLVTYQKSGARVDQAHVLMEAARYLQERADDADCTEERRRGGCRAASSSEASKYNSEGRSSVGSSVFSATSKQTVSSSSKESKESKQCHRMIDQEQLRKSLENLVRYFAQRADESDDREWTMITGIAERLLLDVTDCIRKDKPLNHDLLTRIRELNKLAKQATLQSEKKSTKCTLGRSHTRV
ncbi:hypothetical protein GCK32_002899 [Trichostrongylus colubriformis]|uniref:Uncharacterized protein n=1 Tax=Trichostrongylus colubriformis TaxID=6319 RepID=A0AAN8FLJ0_TRICO